MKKLVVLVAAAMAAVASFGVDFRAEAKNKTVAKEFTGANGKVFRYRWAEKASQDGSKVPLVLFLHGAGERGTDNAAQLVQGVGELVCWLDAHEKGYRLVAGQVPKGKRWVEVDWNAKSHDMPKEPSETMALLLEFLDKQLEDPAVDTTRVYVTGISMGGYGTWDIVCRRPGLFAAAVPICGGGDVAQAPRIAKVPIWGFHGSADGAVPVCRTRSMMAALWAAGSNAHYREYPDANHDVWNRTYRDDKVLSWFFGQRGKTRAEKIRAKLESADRDYVFVVMHRGDWRHAPENSIGAIKGSIAHGADIIELENALSEPLGLLHRSVKKMAHTCPVGEEFHYYEEDQPYADGDRHLKKALAAEKFLHVHLDSSFL